MSAAPPPIHAALRHLEQQRVVVRAGNLATVARRPKRHDHFAATQTVGPQERIELKLMERMLRGGWAPGHEFSEADLARESGASTASVREFLIGFSRFHLVEKRSRSGWRLLGLNVDFANEVADMRQLIEMQALQRIFLPEDKIWKTSVDDLLIRHHQLRQEIDRKYLDFPALDREFHLFLISQMQNRFAEKFFDVVSFVFHYHYKWNTDDQKARVACSLDQHIGILEALGQSNLALAQERLAEHLSTARVSLVRWLEITEHDDQRGLPSNGIASEPGQLRS